MFNALDGKLLSDIKKEIDQIPMVNAHDHIECQGKIMESAKNISFLYNLLLVSSNNNFLSYLPDEAWRTAQTELYYGDERGLIYNTEEKDLNKIWEKIKPVINYGLSSPHYRMFMRASKSLFNLDYDHLNSKEKWFDLSNKISEANRKKEWYGFVLKEKANTCCNIVMRGSIPDIKEDYFYPAIIMDDFLSGYDNGVLLELEEKYDFEVNDFEDFLSLIDKAFKVSINKGAVTVKNWSAYKRGLDFKNVTKRDAIKAFQPVIHQGWARKSIDYFDIRNFQDYIMHKIIENCIEYDIPIQIHTGPPAPIVNSNPIQLIELIEQYPAAKFVILHVGGPYAGEFAVMTKFNSNIFIDLAWLLNSYPGPSGVKRLLNEWLEVIPWDKFVWGADGCAVEYTYGFVMTAREVLTEVLTQKIQENFVNEETAIEIGKKIIRDNALNLYKINCK